jgi:NAD-dependent dihydropyrimidine dehydrogenase PreA subunit
MTTTATTKPTILYCNCSHRELLVPELSRRQVRIALSKTDAHVLEVADFCELAARRDPVLATLAQAADLRIVACHRRTIKWLFTWAGMDLAQRVPVLNMRTQTPETVIAGATAGTSTRHEPAAPADLAPLGHWVPWFPVLDRSRCTNCLQCLSFCPFGVYTIQEERVVVTQPANCKNNCPACARICPALAIIFPKSKDSPIDGSEVTAEDMARPRTVPELGPDADLHSILARRRMKTAGRFARNLQAESAPPPSTPAPEPSP